MPLTRIRQTAIGNDSITTAKLDDTSGGLTLPGVEYVKVPVGTTAQRPSSPVNGYMRYNTNFERLEQYANGQWQSIDTPPSITSLSYSGSLTAADPAGGETITLAGSNFQANATVTVDGTSATSVSVVSSTSITFTTPAKTAGDYDVVVTNANGLAATLLNGISYNGVPSFTTAAGNVGSIAEDQAMSTITIVAAEPDGGTLAYSITSGALPTGVSMSSAGAITGTPNVNPTSNTTFNFTVTATDDENQTNSRAFNLIVLRPIYATSIDNSLRFNDDDSAYLTRTASSAGNRRTWTWSAWVKKGNNNVLGHMLWGGGTAIGSGTPDHNATIIRFNSDNKLLIYSSDSDSASLNLTTTQVFRDVGAWMHLLVAFDTTQSTNSDRIKLYVNGSQVTSFSTETYPSQNYETHINENNIVHILGCKLGPNPEYFYDGYMSDVYLIDGQALTPTSFAEEYYGVWVPKSYSGTFGTNGFRLPFEQSFTSGNSIDFGTNRTNTITHSDASSYDIGASDDFTIEYFFKTQDVGANYGNWMGHYATGGPHHLIAYDFRSSTRSLYFYSGNGQSLLWNIAADVTLFSDTWHHVVFQRNGTVLRAYVDGTRLTSVSNATASWSLSDGKATNFNQAYDLSQIIMGDPYGQGMTGSLSNVRYVIGSTVYADDDNDITVPTSSLTAVANTKLLTAVNSTLGDDISSENNDGSASGSPTVSNVSPFGAQFYNDASSNGNNFSNNGLSTTDVVPDSPTNNFSTNNGAMRANITHSEGNLKMVGVGNNFDNMASTFTFDVEDADGWYWEYRSIGNDSSTTIGISTPQNSQFNQSDPTSAFSNTTACVGYQGNGNKQLAGSNSSYGDSWTAGDIIGIAVKAGSVYFYKNGVIQNSGTAAATGLTGRYVAAFAINGTNSGVSNYGQDSTFAGLESAASNSDANGLGEFAYTVPTGYKALYQKNIPESTINTTLNDRPEEYFNTVLYTGDGTSSRGVTGVGFAPDWVWLKTRDTTGSNFVYDTIRGATNGLHTNLADAETTYNDGLLSFDSDGFTVGDRGNHNGNNELMVAWCWKAGGAPTATNSAGAGNVPTSGSVMIDGVASTSALAGTVPATKLTANTKTGFSIVSYTGTGSNATVAHGLSQTPEWVATKSRDSALSWYIYVPDHMTTNQVLAYNAGNAQFGSAGAFIEGDFNATTFGVGTETPTNKSGDDFIAYCFHSVEGYSKIGSYVGNGNANGSFIYTGFRSAWVMIKNITTGGTNWLIFDNKRSVYNVTNDALLASSSNAESVNNSSYAIDILSNGFKARSSYGDVNQSGNTFIYLAYAEDPFKYSEAK